jgi:hypothetical protein
MKEKLNSGAEIFTYFSLLSSNYNEEKTRLKFFVLKKTYTISRYKWTINSVINIIVILTFLLPESITRGFIFCLL